MKPKYWKRVAVNSLRVHCACPACERRVKVEGWNMVGGLPMCVHCKTVKVMPDVVTVRKRKA